METKLISKHECWISIHALLLILLLLLLPFCLPPLPCSGTPSTLGPLLVSSASVNIFVGHFVPSKVTAIQVDQVSFPSVNNIPENY